MTPQDIVEGIGPMAADNNLAPVIIKRKKVVAGDGHHGGAWKVAMLGFPYSLVALRPVSPGWFRDR